MGKARTGSSRKRRTMENTGGRTAIEGNSHSNGNYHYESFPIAPSPSRSRSNSPIRGLHQEIHTTSATPFHTNITTTTNTATTNTTTTTPQTKIVSTISGEDPGNPFGNAVDFCVNQMSLPNSIETMNSVLKPCQEQNLQQMLEDICSWNKTTEENATAGGANNSTTADQELGGDSLLLRSGGKRDNHKNGWKKTMKIVPGKKFLRSMSFKRKRSNPRRDTASSSHMTSSGTTTANHNQNSDNDEDSLFKGIIDDHEPEVDDIITIPICESDEDTLFTNLEHDATWTTAGSSPAEPLPKDFAIDISKVDDDKFDDEGKARGTSTAAAAASSGFMCFAASALCPLSSLSRTQHGGSDANANNTPTGDLVAPRAFENNKATPADSRKFSFGSRATANEAEEEDKMEFEMILEADSRGGTRKWGAITPWKKIETFFANRNYNIGKKRKSNHQGGSLQNDPSASWGNEDDQEGQQEALELVLDDLSLSRNVIEPRTSSQRRSRRILKKRRLQLGLLGLSSRSRRQHKSSSSVSKSTRPSWKRMMVISLPIWLQPRSQRGGVPSEEASLGSKSDVESINSSTDSNPLEYSETDEERSAATLSRGDGESATAASNHGDDSSIEAKDASPTSAMGRQEWSWGVFNMDHKDEDEEEHPSDERAQDLVGLPLFGPPEEYDSATDYSAQDGDTYFNDNDSNHDGWIMSEDQLSSTDEDSSRKTRLSDGYTSNGSVTSCEEDDDDFQEQTKKSSKKSRSKREGFLSLSKSIRKGFSPKKKNSEKAIDVSSDICINTEACDDKAIDADGTSATIETVLLTKGVKGTRGPFFSSFMASKKSTPPVEDRNDDCTSSSIRGKNDDNSSDRDRPSNKGTTFSKAKNFWKQQSSSMKPPRLQRRSRTKSSSVAATNSSARKWNLVRGNASVNAETDPTIPTTDIVTVVTTPKARDGGRLPTVATSSTAATLSTTQSKAQQLHEYRPEQNQVSLLDTEPDEDESVDNDRDSEYDETTASASTDSRSWARDDEDSQSEDYSLYGFDFFRSHEVIRE